MAKSQPGDALTGFKRGSGDESVQSSVISPSHFDGAPSKGLKTGQTLFNSKGWA
jgi:hypothetical protein